MEVLGLTGQVAIVTAAGRGIGQAIALAPAVEWARHGITVNAVAPGYVKTALNADVLADPRTHAQITGRTPMGRLGETSDVTGAVLYLASASASFVTGHVLAIDGGWLAS